MKVAVLMWSTGKGQYGGAQEPANSMYDILKELKSQGHEIEFDMVLASNRGKLLGSWIHFDHPVRVVKYSEYADVLNSYDRIIMVLPGPIRDKGSIFTETLLNLKVPFSFRLCGEIEEKQFPIMPELMKNPYFDGIIVTTMNLVPFYKGTTLDEGFTRAESMDRIIELEPLLRVDRHLLDNPDIDSLIRTKGRSIVSTSRWVSYKRIKELCQITPDLVKEGIFTYVWGEGVFYADRLEIEQTNPDYWVKRGSYDYTDVDKVLSPHRFLWDVSMRKSGKTIPRFNYTAYEAIWNGTIPIQSELMVPEWFQGDHVIKIPFDFENFNKNSQEVIVSSFNRKDIEEIAHISYDTMRKFANINKLCRQMLKILRLE